MGAWFEGFVELCELMDLGLRMSWEQLEGTNAALCRFVEWLAGWSDDGAPRRRESSIDHDPHR